MFVYLEKILLDVRGLECYLACSWEQIFQSHLVALSLSSNIFTRMFVLCSTIHISLIT